MARSAGRAALVAVLVWLGWPATGHGQDKDKVYRQVAPEQLEAIFKGLGIAYQKAPVKGVPGAVAFEYEVAQKKVRLGLYEGNHLWLSVRGPALAAEVVNAWNGRARVSRAVTFAAEGASVTALESQLDGGGGVTEGMLRQFLLRFEAEVKEFNKFTGK